MSECKEHKMKKILHNNIGTYLHKQSTDLVNLTEMYLLHTAVFSHLPHHPTIPSSHHQNLVTTQQVE